MAQSDKFKSNFIAPMDIPLYLSGNFGELRSGHFHTGIDIKTLGKAGIPVKSIADGYLARVYVASGGYGKALYINHPNGMTSVYGHLEGFSEKIDSVVKNLQYKNERFKLDKSFKKGEIMFSKGEVIALSGNSGSSGGPHLHFEIRNTQTEHPLNPLHFGFNIKDEMRPQIMGIKVFPIDGKGVLNRGSEPNYYPAVFYGNAFHLKAKPKIKVFGQVGIGLETFDYLTGDWSKCGTYSADLYVDNVLMFCWKIDSLDFDELRYINTFCDYSTRVNNYKWVVKMFKDEPNNKFSNYCKMGDGIIHFTDNKVHHLKLVVHDAYGNKSHLEFSLYSEKTAIVEPEQSGMQYFKWDENMHFKNDKISIAIPKGALYNSTYLDIQNYQAKDLLSDVFMVHRLDVALHKNIEIGIKAPNSDNTNKLYLAQVNKTGKVIGSVSSTSKAGWVYGSTRSFGYFALDVDTIAPTLVSLDVSDKRVIHGKKTLRFKIDDKQSGIAKFSGTIDGKWILMDYDLKKKIVTYTFDSKRVEKGKHHNLVLKTEDGVGNVAVFQCGFTW